MTPHLQLLLKMADLWAAHIQAAAQENPGDAEIQQELTDLLTLRNQIETQFNAEQAVEDIPQRIIDYLQQNDPDCQPVVVTRFDERTNSKGNKVGRWLVDTRQPMAMTSYEALEAIFQEQLVLNWSPLT